ncbi:MAG: TM0106 family RecB-like putative nuclease [Candidatus Eisenbacteria bacterium]|uniref:TM0106 family RecB-like putative nuclease n=1 Tax=Eiseniibacteriota bacterium TaxID=2212470 RepID=A0A849SRC3_UNCEI|nr:TM0106 family RecB-like putative nuclease [Candidatus Eisenbacteria bacterium]
MRRLWLKVHAPELGSGGSEFDRRLADHGIAHEREVAARIPGLVGPLFDGHGDLEAAAERTLELLRTTRDPLYQPAFLSRDGRRAGVPDFVLHDGDGLVLRDAKTFVNPGGLTAARLQMAHYSALVEESLGAPPLRCEVINGRHEVLRVELPPRAEYDALIARMAAVIESPDEPELLQSHSKCEGCGFYGHCWPRAIREGWIEILPAVNRMNQPQLARLGLGRIPALAAADPVWLTSQGIKGRTEDLVLEARSRAEGRALWRRAPGMPSGRTLVWFDLEGDPSADVEVPIYLWGYAVDAQPTATSAAALACEAVIAAPGRDGDRAAWEDFLTRAAAIFASHPDALWIHYDEYERTWLKRYLERYGDRAAIGARLLNSMFDLCRALKQSAVLPITSYSIKRVAAHLGFKWSDPAMGSQWSIVQYERARAAPDVAERERLFEPIRSYNADDLRAMKCVWDWMVRDGLAP